jgi:hypothetical protein
MMNQNLMNQYLMAQKVGKLAPMELKVVLARLRSMAPMHYLPHQFRFH